MVKKLDNTYKKLTQEKKLSVVFFGGSVTAGACASEADKTSWRALTGEYLKNKYQDADITAVNAAIGGTGTGLGLFRMDRDVLPHNPDLVFIEFTINDIYQKYTLEESLIYYESIIKRLYARNPYVDIVIAFITDRNIVYNGSKFIDAHASLAAHYNIPTISFNDALANELKVTGNPIDNYLNDWVHPNDGGYALYAKTACDYLEKELSYPHDAPTPVQLPQQYSQNLILGETHRVEIENMPNIEPHGFVKESGDFGAKVVYNCYHIGDELHFTFTGTYVGAWAHSWKDEEATSKVVCIVDGEEVGNASFRKNDHSAIHVSFAKGLPYGEHKVVLRNCEDGKGTIQFFLTA